MVFCNMLSTKIIHFLAVIIKHKNQPNKNAMPTLLCRSLKPLKGKYAVFFY